MCAYGFQYIPKEKYVMKPIIEWEIRCPICEDDIEAEYDGTYWICKACGYLTDCPEGITNVTEREEFRKEFMRDKQERDFYREYETPNDRDMLF